MKIGILYIGTGKYSQFFKTFYSSSEKHFLNGIAEKDYYVFTDDLSIQNTNNIFVIRKECRGFPFDSLFRFDMFLEIKEKLINYDYLYFFNSNMLFVKDVGIEILPQREKLVALVHPLFYNKKAFLYPYERNKHSKAYIPSNLNNYKYYMGALNGGEANEYLKLIETCSIAIHDDYQNGIIAFFHDESHLNKYLSDKQCLSLSPSYGYPEGRKLPFDKIIIIRDKVKIDKSFAKSKSLCENPIFRFKRFFNTIIRIINWYI